MKDNVNLNSKDPRGRWNYFVEYKFIPDLVNAFLDNRCPVNILTDIGYWKKLFNSYMTDVCFDWESFSCSSWPVKGNCSLILYTFPLPVEIPQAAFGAIFLDVKNSRAEYYTLEMSFDNQWYVGAVDGERHLNFGTLEDFSKQNFIDWVLMHCAGI